MAIGDVLWACPLCQAIDSIRKAGRAERCTGCGATYERARGAAIRAARGGEAPITRSAVEWLAALPALDERFAERDDALRGPQPVLLRAAETFVPIRANGTLLGWAERFGPRRAATLELTTTALRFVEADGSVLDIPLEQLTAIQPSSSALQLGSRDRPLLNVRFRNSSVVLWEHFIQSRMRRRFRELGLGHITEWQPVIRTEGPGSGSPETHVGAILAVQRPEMETDDAGRTYRQPGWLYRLCQWIVRTAWRRFGTLDIQGVEHIPSRGPCLLICNHQSDLDPLLIQSVIRRPMHTVAKSTLFLVPGLRWILPRICAFPVRRYRTDPQAVRLALRRLDEGCGVAIFIEGERSWDGQLQAPRPGTVRLALKAGVPIVPCSISGSYEASPRWHSRIRPGPVSIRIMPPMRFPALDRRQDREAVREQAARLMMDALARGLETCDSAAASRQERRAGPGQ